MNNTDVIEIISIKTNDFDVLSLVLGTIIGIATIIITYSFFNAVNKQVNQGKKILEYHDREYNRNSKRITFEIADKFLKDIRSRKEFKEFVDDVCSGKAIDDERNILDLVDMCEILAIKYFNLGLDLEVLDECLGNILVSIFSNESVLDVKKMDQTGNDFYSNLDRLYPSLKKIRKGKSSMSFEPGTKRVPATRRKPVNRDKPTTRQKPSNMT